MPQAQNHNQTPGLYKYSTKWDNIILCMAILLLHIIDCQDGAVHSTMTSTFMLLTTCYEEEEITWSIPPNVYLRP